MKEDLISIREAANIRGLSTQRIYQLIHCNRLRYEVIDGQWRVYRSEVLSHTPGLPGRRSKKQTAEVA